MTWVQAGCVRAGIHPLVMGVGCEASWRRIMENVPRHRALPVELPKLQIGVDIRISDLRSVQVLKRHLGTAVCNWIHPCRSAEESTQLTTLLLPVANLGANASLPPSTPSRSQHQALHVLVMV